MVHRTFIHGEHLQRVALKTMYQNHPNIIHTYYRPGTNRLPCTHFGYPGPNSLTRAPSSVIPDRTPYSAHRVRFNRTPTSNLICRGFRSPPASRPGSGKLPTRLSCLPCRYYTRPMYRPNEGGSTSPTNGTLTMRL